MDIRTIKLDELEFSPETSEWLDEEGLLSATVGDLIAKFPDPYDDDAGDARTEAADDLCRALGYYIWWKHPHT